MLQNKKAVIFDLDGTLVESMWIWEEVDRLYKKKYNLNPPKDFYTFMEGMSFTEVANHYKKTFDMKLTIEEIKAEWHEMTMDLYATQVKIKPFVREMLEHCRAKGLKMGIASSCTTSLITIVLQKNKIYDYFETIVTSCEVGVGKPAPDVYLKAAENLGVNPEECIVFEDVPNGVIGAKAGNMSTCAIEDAGNKDYRDKLKELADHYISSFEEVVNVPER